MSDVILEKSQQTFFRELVHLETEDSIQFFDLTPYIHDFISRTGVKQGLVLARTFHTTTAVCVNEKEPGLLYDLIRLLKNIIPDKHEYYHDDPNIHKTEDPNERQNGFAHLRALLLGSDVTLSIVDGKLTLGKWQSVFFLELDGPREKRTVELVIMTSAK